jgi:hypothetical protein
VLSVIEDLSPHARVATAVVPFFMAMLLRVALGGNKLTRMLISLGTMWFAVNVLAAPYSARMRQDIVDLQYIFR